MHTNLIASSTILLSTLILSSCGGGGGSDDDGDNAKTGVFIDSAVEGLSFSTKTQSGLTNSKGEFKYLEGEVITFNLGKIEIGSTFGAEYISPLDIINSFLPADESASNLAQLLQTLDTDNNPDNGITLPSTIAALPANLDVNDATAVEAALGQALISATDAVNHLNSSISAFPPRSVDDVYQRVTIGSTGLAGCPDVVDAEVTVSRDTAGTRVYDGTITLAGGGQYTFTADDSTIRNPSITDDPDHSYRVDLNTFEGSILVLTNDAQPSKCSEIRLTTDSAVNLPPIVRSPSHITTSPGCTSPSNTYNITAYFYGHDKDGFIVNDIDAKFAVEGGDLTTLVNQGNNSSCDDNTDTLSWNPAAPTNGGWYCSNSNDVMEDIPCTSGYNWEVSATDNEGLTTTITGGDSAPLEGNGGATGTLFQCNEAYPSDACDLLINTSSLAASVTSHANGSCSSLVPQPSTTISSSDIATADPSIFTGNVIINYNSFSELTPVSCLVTIQ